MIRATAPAVVVSIPVGPGDEVDVGDPLVVVESMKMETAIAAPFRVGSGSVLVRQSVQVDAGAPLLRTRPTGRRRQPPRG